MHQIVSVTCVLYFIQSGSNSYSSGTRANEIGVSKPIKSAIDPADDGCGHTQGESASGNGQIQAARDGHGQITLESVSCDVQTLVDDDEDCETENELVSPVQFEGVETVVPMSEPLR